MLIACLAGSTPNWLSTGDVREGDATDVLQPGCMRLVKGWFRDEGVLESFVVCLFCSGFHVWHCDLHALVSGQLIMDLRLNLLNNGPSAKFTHLSRHCDACIRLNLLNNGPSAKFTQ